MKVKLLLITSILSITQTAWAVKPLLNSTKSRLQVLEQKINKLQKSISSAHDKQSLLNKELTNTENKIAEGQSQLHAIEQDMSNTQNKINGLQLQVKQQNAELKAQQLLLAEHIKTRYQMGEYQPVKWLLNQENPHDISRLLTFYQYLIQSRQSLIANIKETRENLNLSRAKLDNEIQGIRNLQNQLSLRQQKLSQEKHYHQALIHSLDQDIVTGQQTLAEYKRNRDNLTRLMSSLAQESVMQTKSPFPTMRHKLPLPVQISRRAAQRVNQGLMFYAPEGAAVSAVYPGKVVFSDWLKGYGLLLIIDHGRGFMTLYAHNQSLLKHKGETVGQGEQIAAVGHSGGILQNGLYFEVRERGKAVPPLGWLS